MHQSGNVDVPGGNTARIGRLEAPTDNAEHKDHNVDQQSARYIRFRSLSIASVPFVESLVF